MVQYSMKLLSVNAPYSLKRLLPASVILMASVLGMHAKELIPLEVYTMQHDMAKVREAVRGGFEDIVGSPTLVNEFDYMQILLEPNGFITLEEHRCDIYFYETLEGLMIRAVPYDMVNGQKVEVTDFTTRKGVYMMIEGAAEELNYEVEIRQPIPEGIGGFLNFTPTMKLLSEELDGGQTPTISLANYPQTGRVYRLLTPNGTGMVQLEEDPAAPDHCLRMWVVQELPAGEPSRSVEQDMDVVRDWLKEIRDELLDDQGPKMHRVFFESQSEQYEANGFTVQLSAQAAGAGVNKNLLVQDAPSVKASKQAY